MSKKAELVRGSVKTPRGADRDPERLIANSLPKTRSELYNRTRMLITTFARDVIVDNRVLQMSPLEYYSMKSVVLHSNFFLSELDLFRLTFSTIRDVMENLFMVFLYLISLNSNVAVSFARCLRRLIICVLEYTRAFKSCKSSRYCDLFVVSRSLLSQSRDVYDVRLPHDSEILPKISDITKGKLLGSGGFGDVYKAVLAPFQMTICVKVIPGDRFHKSETACTDKMVASIIDSPFLCNYLASFKTPNAYMTLLEYIPGVDLRRVLQRSQFINGEPLKYIVAQIWLAVEHLHTRGFIHRDIKTENTICLSSGRIKVIDYDTAKVCLSHFVTNRNMPHFFDKTADELKCSDRAGTLPYMAPEILAKRQYGRSVDLWAIGICIYKLLTGVLPFRQTNKQTVEQRILHRNFKWPELKIDDKAKKFVERLLIKSPELRLGSRTNYSVVKSHPFFEKINFDQLASMERVCTIPGLDDVLGSNSPVASGGAVKRIKCPIDEVQSPDGSTFLPLMTLCSAEFRHLQMNRTTRRRTGSERSFGFLDEQSILQRDFAELMSGKPKLQHFSIALPSKTCWSEISFRWIKGVSGYFPQIVSLTSRMAQFGLLKGDIIAAINERLVPNLNKKTLWKAMTLFPDTCTFSVFQLSIWRCVLGPLKTFPLFIESIVEDLQIKLKRCCCSSKIPMRFEVLSSGSCSYWVIKEILSNKEILEDQTNMPGAKVCVGDVLWDINGIRLDEISESPEPTHEEVLEVARRASAGQLVSIGLIPISPIRVEVTENDLKPYITRQSGLQVRTSQDPKPDHGATKA